MPVEQLRHYIINADKTTSEFGEKLHAIKQQMQLDELMYLSTCNRVTYFFTTQHEVLPGFTTNFFKSVNANFEACNTVNANFFEGQEALEHLCEVSASLDSMVVGEREIIRQLRMAYEDSNELKLTGDDIRLAMKMLIPAAKKIYSETKIAEKPISIVSLATKKLKQLKVPKNARFIFIGAGETIAQMSTYLIDLGYHDFTIFNRTLANAEKLAGIIKGKAYPLSHLPDFNEGFDVIITSTGSNKKELTTSIFEGLVNGESSNKIIIDLAIPLDTEPEILDRFSVEYIQIDDLRIVAQKNLSSRKSEVIKAKQLVHEFVKEFQSVYIERMVEKAHSIIPIKLNEIKRKALDEVYAKDIAALDEHSKAVMEKVLDYMEKKYIALTMSSSKGASRHKH